MLLPGEFSLQSMLSAGLAWRRAWAHWLVAAWLFCLCSNSLLLYADPAAALPSQWLEAGSTFCRDEGPRPIAWSAHSPRPPGIELWKSFCTGDADMLRASSRPFAAPAQLGIYLAGYPATNGLTLSVQQVSSGKLIELRPLALPGEAWRHYSFALPPTWQGQQVRLVAVDESRVPLGWFAFSEPVPAGSAGRSGLAALQLGVLTLLHAVLLALPAAAACLLAARWGYRDPAWLVVVALLAIGMAGYASFWLYFAVPPLATAASWVLVLASAAVVAQHLRGARRQAFRDFRPLGWPVLLVFASTLMSLGFCYLYGGLEDPIQTAATRLTHHLPPDNLLPFLLSESIAQGKVPRPLFPEWLSSDRPPLQAGMVLLQYPFMGANRPLHYEIISALLQGIWLLPMWLLLQRLNLPSRAVAWALGLTLFTGTGVLYTFYVWPKLLPAAYLLALLAFLLPQEDKPQKDGKWGAAMGLLAAFALLSHGGSIFGLAPLAFFWLARGYARTRIVLPALAALVLLYAPWSLYQKYVDPPANRLTKWHLAGVAQIDPRTLGQALSDEYGRLTMAQIAEYKWANLKVPFQDVPRSLQNTGLLLQAAVMPSPHHVEAAAAAARDLRDFQFFRLLPALGLLLPGFFLPVSRVLRPYSMAALRASGQLRLYALLILPFWCLLMFGPSTTVLHQGTLVLVLTAMAGSVLALWAVRPVLAYVLGGANVIVTWWIYVWLNPVSVEGAPIWHRDPLWMDVSALSLFALCLTAWALWEMGRTPAAQLQPSPVTPIVTPPPRAVPPKGRSRAKRA